MRIKRIRISGFRCIPFCAQYVEPQERNAPAQIAWDDNPFQIVMPTGRPMIGVIIGPNSSGKSSVLYALDLFFSSTRKLPEDSFNGRDTQHPVIVEITFTGPINEPGDWHEANCLSLADGYELTIAYVWTAESRAGYIRKPNGEYHKIGSPDKRQIESLLPEYRLIPADTKLSDAANPERKNLINDLIQELFERQVTNRSILHKIRKAIHDLRALADRSNPPNQVAWREIEELEQALSVGLSNITPGNPGVRLQIRDAIPSLQDIFLKSKVRIRDGIELDFERHGLGLQRSFVASALHAWWEYVGCRQEGKDYVFAVEEPEIFLHPHATRVFLNVLIDIAERDQVLFTTHSVEFVNRVPLDNVIRLKRIDAHQRQVVQPDLSDLSPNTKQKVQRYLQEDRSDMLFARAVLLVEGQAEMFAIPAFARQLGCDLDKAGISVVFVNGKGNFSTYHHILEAFGVRHVILADGDGQQAVREQEYGNLVGTDKVFVLEEDFEHLLVTVLDEQRLLQVINECRHRKGMPPLESLPLSDVTPESLQSHWWMTIKEAIHSDVSPEHRNHYGQQKQEIRDLLEQLAQAVVASGHIAPTAGDKRRANLLKRLGKPLVGRVVGEMLTEEEIRRMSCLVQAIEKTLELVQ